MSDREKVIKGLECCLPMMSERKVADCRNCPYDVEITLNGILDCHKTLLTDALKLLEAQEPVEPTWRRGFAFCGKCGRQFVRGYKNCPDCGQAVKWDG